MDWFEYVVIGSGPAGVSAAYRLRGGDACLVDVGETSLGGFHSESLQSALAAGDVSMLLGSRWEMLANLVLPQKLHQKLRAPDLRFVLNGEPFKVSDPGTETTLHSACSFAAGGMSNVWGGQLLRYTNDDLADAGGWPFSVDVLEPFYSQFEEHIGISGESDDMQAFLGGPAPAMKPVPMVRAAERLYSRYRKSCNKKRGLLLGRPRLGLTTEGNKARPAHKLGETEFFTCGQPGLYTAKVTLDELKAGYGITYLDRHRLLGWREDADYVELDLFDLENHAHRSVRARHLLLGCGTIQTARLILLAYGGRGQALPFIDHQPTLLPIFLPGSFGSELPVRSYPIQLLGTLAAAGRRDMITFYYPGGLLWSDLLPDIPLPMDSSLRILGVLLGGMLVAQIWEASRPIRGNQLRLDEVGGVLIDYPVQTEYSGLRELLGELRPLGAFSMARLARLTPPGWGFHHAGTLPMCSAPGPFETHIDGRLWNSRRVRVIDGSVLPSLPAKNHSLTIMANAARIADEVTRCGY